MSTTAGSRPEHLAGGPSQHPSAAIWRSPLRRLAVLAGLTGFAVAQPVLGVLGEEPTILAQHGIDGTGLLALGAVVALVPPLALWAAEVLVAGARRRAGAGVPVDRVVHLLLVGALAALFAIQLAKSIGLPGALALSVALAVGAGFAVAYVRHAAVATWASYTVLLPFLALGTFAFTSPASALRDSAQAPERIDSGTAPSVVMLVLDELPTRSILAPDGTIDATRFPSLAELASEATWYRHHTTLATHTEAAVPSMLTGKLPTTDVALWANHPDNLFTLLAPTHELEVLEQATELCPYDVCVPTAGSLAAAEEGSELEADGPGFRDVLGVAADVWLERVSIGDDEPAAFDDFTEQVEVDPGADAPTTTTEPLPSPSITVRQERPDGDPAQALTPSRAQALIDSFDPDKGAALYYLHLILPHQPWKRYPDGTEYDVRDPTGINLPEEDAKQLYSWSPWASAVSEQMHLLQAQYADQLVGQILDGLRSSGLYDDSLVIVTSDHGISFEDRSAGRYVKERTVDAIAYSPLVVKEPRQREGRIDDANVTILDILPTIADYARVDVPWPVEGAPLGSPAIAERGPEKQIYGMLGFAGLALSEIIDFDDREVFPDVAERFIGPLPDPADPLSALNERLGLRDLIGRPIAELVTGQGGSVAVDSLAQLEQPVDGEPLLGLVTGIVDGSDPDDRLLLAIDGTVVGGSRMSTDSEGRTGRFMVLLPQGTLDDGNEVRAALVSGDGAARSITELEVRSL